MSESLNEQRVSVIEDEIIRARVRAASGEAKPASRLQRLTTHPLTPLVVGFILTGVVGTHLTNRYSEEQRRQEYARQAHEKEIEERRNAESQEAEYRRKLNLADLENQRHAHEKEREFQRSKEQKEAELRQAALQRELDFRRSQVNVVEGRKIEHARVLEQYLKYIDSDKPQEREFAYQMFVSLGYEKLAANIIALRGDLAGKGVLQSLKGSADESVKQLAVSGLRAIKEEELRRLEAITNIFESGRDRSSVFDDTLLAFGAKGQFQQLIKLYNERPDAKYRGELAPYLARIETDLNSLREDPKFKSLVKQIDNDPAMDEVERAYQRKLILAPALTEAESLGIKTVLGLAAVYDTLYHSGRGAHNGIKNKTAEQLGGTPLSGVDEKLWVKSYVSNRRDFLATHRTPVVRRTVSRADAFLELIEAANWHLTPPLKIKGINVD